MAARAARQHHYLWHQVRNMWLAYDDATRAALRQRGWEPPRPSQGPPPDRALLLDNGSGEDFLYMHREMIGAVNRVLAEVADPKYPRVEGWPQVPPPGDTEYPVPPAWETGNPRLDESLVEVKSDDAYEGMTEWETALKDPVRLRQWSLGRLGALVEYTVHNQMHMRWAAESEIRPDVDPTASNSISEQWDRPSYNWLGDPYSSHVNSVFWKIHGWVDARIDDWMSANGHTGEVPWSTARRGSVRCRKGTNTTTRTSCWRWRRSRTRRHGACRVRPSQRTRCTTTPVTWTPRSRRCLRRASSTTSTTGSRSRTSRHNAHQRGGAPHSASRIAFTAANHASSATRSGRGIAPVTTRTACFAESSSTMP
jgi:hypothetical protein